MWLNATLMHKGDVRDIVAMGGILWPWDLPMGVRLHRENDCSIGMRNLKINTLTCTLT